MYMKKLLSISVVFCSLTAVAQDSFMNEQALNNSSDVIGTSRYVGMGGAMGALGADMSVISWNPAGIGMYRKNDVAITFGGLWGKSHIEEERRGIGTLDQVGMVYSMPTDSEICPYVNFGFNYQKKKNFFANFYADNPNLFGISQMDQLAELATLDLASSYNLAGLVYRNNALTPVPGQAGKFYNKYDGEFNNYTHHSEGSLRSWDFNVSTNIQDRYYLGLTFGVDNIYFSGITDYYEGSSYIDDQGEKKYGNYSIWNDYRISGYGFNFKLGGIVRPFVDNSFRVGLVVESPTWYKLKSDIYMDYTDEVSNPVVRSQMEESYLEYNICTPWKFRAMMGSTVGSMFAWDIDYEYANYASMSQRYPKYYNTYGGIKDLDMNRHMRENLKGVHTIRAGVEVRPVAPLAFRLGYNFSTSAYDQNAHFDQICFDNGDYFNSPALDYTTRTNFMVTKPAHILCLGMGYKWKHFYFDLAYKLRHQKADFYAFDDSFIYNSEFMDNFRESHPGATASDIFLAPVPVDLTRHSITCTLGVKF